ncbi:hypothetical protein [Geomobilimonas luticola]|uniref:Uncharacterized protein n=1 Tax=Geomobilimonas luticola TaxID=1114878 RepID=A0ABS5S9S1_9BACT|nr:hypothetical protein [Geomobilimonas luticola]MBT0652116.1 hypothetical protein [Geomobilimonas luticola]
MLSTSNLTIEWVKPDIAAERWEFTSHPDKQGFYLRHDIGWDQIVAGFDAGRLVAYPRAEMVNGVPVGLSYSSYDDYARYLAKAKRGYRRNYSLMEESLQRRGTLTLPAPIILQCGDEALLFSGYRRLCLAWNYGMVPFVWLLPAGK